MTISYSLAPIVKWPMINNVGTLAGGSKLYTWSNLNRTQQKAVYQDIGGNVPYTNPIVFDENGTEGPFFWKVDSTNLADTYFLQAFDSSNNLLWTMEDYSPGTSGGGGNTTTYISTDNLIANNIFLNNVGNIAAPINSTDVVIAPGNHQGFVNIIGTTGGDVGPDTRFIKNVTTASDSITFAPFIAGNNPLGTDVTPPVSIQYISTAVLGETYKYFQFPICAGVKNLESREMTFTCWMKTGSGAPNFAVTLRQYFGSGGAPSADVITPVGTQVATTTWAKVDFNFTVPSIVGKTLGSCGDDGIYILINMPTGVAVDISFAKPCLFVGEINPSFTFETYDQIDAVVQGFRTGDTRTSINTFTPYGWVAGNDGTIGSPTSNATARANIDTFPLFAAIWALNPTDAVMYSSAGAVTARGASFSADFAANNQIALPKSIGQVFAGSGAGNGTQSVTSYDFTISSLNVTNAVTFGIGTPVILFNSGGALPTGLSSTTIYYSIFTSATQMQLASSIGNALAAIPVGFSDNGSGTNTIGVYDVAASIFLGQFGSGSAGAAGGATFTGVVNGSSTAFNTTQPTTFMNVFFKL